MENQFGFNPSTRDQLNYSNQIMQDRLNEINREKRYKQGSIGTSDWKDDSFLEPSRYTESYKEYYNNLNGINNVAKLVLPNPEDVSNVNPNSNASSMSKGWSALMLMPMAGTLKTVKGTQTIGKKVLGEVGEFVNKSKMVDGFKNMMTNIIDKSPHFSVDESLEIANKFTDSRIVNKLTRLMSNTGKSTIKDKLTSLSKYPDLMEHYDKKSIMDEVLKFSSTADGVKSKDVISDIIKNLAINSGAKEAKALKNATRKELYKNWRSDNRWLGYVMPNPYSKGGMIGSLMNPLNTFNPLGNGNIPNIFSSLAMGKGVQLGWRWGDKLINGKKEPEQEWAY